VAVPTQDDALANWSTNFSTRISAGAVSFGLTTALATAYATLHGSFLTARAAASVPGTRSASLVAAKNTAKAALVANARDLYQIVQGTPSVTNAQREDLGITVRKAEPTPIPPPDAPPALVITSVSGWTVSVRLRDSVEAARRGRPLGCAGASVFSFVGATPPGDIASWKFEANTGKTKFDVAFDPSLAPGTRVYLTAFWFSGRKQSGPACAPVGTNLQGGTVLLVA
jgi:hypothetical protein